MTDKNRGSAPEGLGSVSKKPSFFGKISDKVRKIAEATREKLAAIGLAGMVGASAAQADAAVHDIARKDQVEKESAFAVKNESHIDTRFDVFESGDKVGAAASIMQVAGPTALGVAAASNGDSTNIKAAIAHQYAHGGVVGANILFNNSKYAPTGGNLQGGRLGVDYSHLVDGRTSIDVGASYTHTFDQDLGSQTQTQTSTRTILENGSNNTYRDTLTTNTTTRYIGGNQTEYYLGATSRLSDNLAISAGANYGKDQMTGRASLAFANGGYEAGLGVQNIGAQNEAPRYDFFANKAIGKNTALGVFASGTNSKDVVGGARLTHSFGGSPVRSNVAPLTSQTPEGSVRQSMNSTANLNSIDYLRIGDVEQVSTTKTDTVLESSTPVETITPSTSEVTLKAGDIERVMITVRSLDGSAPKVFTTPGVIAHITPAVRPSVRSFAAVSSPVATADTPSIAPKSAADSNTLIEALYVVEISASDDISTGSVQLQLGDQRSEIAVKVEAETAVDTPAEISTPRLSVSSDGTLTIQSYGISDADGIRSGSERLYANGASIADGDTLKPGTYIVQASAEVLDASTGEYKVVESDMTEVTIEAPKDTLAPTITIAGPKVITLTQGDTFVMPQVIASDTTDGVVEVKVEGSIDTTKVGTQTLKLTAVDKAGNIGSDTISVTIAAADPAPTAPAGSAFAGLADMTVSDRGGDLPIGVLTGPDAGKTQINAGGVIDPSGRAIRYSATGLPAGLSIDRDTGVISGKYDSIGSQTGGVDNFAVTVTATPEGSRQSISKTFVLSIQDNG